MKKIIIEDADLNEQIHYKSDVETDVFVERFLADNSDPDSLKITVKEMSKAQIDALRYLQESDWWVIRSVDPGDLTPVPEPVVEAREAARSIL